ncbi:MAG: DUF695 domain-containing protein [Acidimicrobiia bacterium]
MARRWRRRIDTGPATWTVADLSVPGAALVVRFDSRFRHDPVARSANPIRVGIALPFNERFGPFDRRQLDKTEDEVERVAAGRGVMVLILTTPEMREHVLYTATGDWIPQFHQDLKRALRKYDVQMMAEEDPDWSVYMEFTRVS